MTDLVGEESGRQIDRSRARPYEPTITPAVVMLTPKSFTDVRAGAG